MAPSAIVFATACIDAGIHVSFLSAKLPSQREDVHGSVILRSFGSDDATSAALTCDDLRNIIFA